MPEVANPRGASCVWALVKPYKPSGYRSKAAPAAGGGEAGEKEKYKAKKLTLKCGWGMPSRWAGAPAGLRPAGAAARDR